jgi:hypothetical protein
MPWKCPACQTLIEHHPSERLPQIGQIYRCHVCHLELTVDPKAPAMILTPLPENDTPRSKHG